MADFLPRRRKIQIRRRTWRQIHQAPRSNDHFPMRLMNGEERRGIPEIIVARIHRLRRGRHRQVVLQHCLAAARARRQKHFGVAQRNRIAVPIPGNVRRSQLHGSPHSLRSRQLPRLRRMTEIRPRDGFRNLDQIRRQPLQQRVPSRRRALTLGSSQFAHIRQLYAGKQR